MIYLGIDVAKNSHVAAAMSSEGEVLLMPFSFANSADGFTLLREKLNNLPKLPLLVGLESTAHYGENLICFLCGNGYHVAMINPLQTAAIRKSDIRKTKTDKVDAFVIANMDVITLFRTYPEFQTILFEWLMQAYHKQWALKSARYQMAAKERYLFFLKEYAGLEDVVSDRFLASFLDMSPETLSRQKRCLREEKPD